MKKFRNLIPVGLSVLWVSINTQSGSSASWQYPSSPGYLSGVRPALYQWSIKRFSFYSSAYLIVYSLDFSSLSCLANSYLSLLFTSSFKRASASSNSLSSSSAFSLSLIFFLSCSNSFFSLFFYLWSSTYSSAVFSVFIKLKLALSSKRAISSISSSYSLVGFSRSFSTFFMRSSFYF